MFPRVTFENGIALKINNITIKFKYVTFWYYSKIRQRIINLTIGTTNPNLMIFFDCLKYILQCAKKE